MIKYRVILADRKSRTAEDNIREADELMLGLVGPNSVKSNVRLARCASRLDGGWELRWSKCLALGAAAVALVGGPLSDEAQASAMQAVSLPQVQSIESNFVPWRGITVIDNSSVAVPSLEVLPQQSEDYGLIAQQSNTTLHSNSHTGHTNMEPSQHSNSEWTNHTNGGHSNGPWWNHVNNASGTDEFNNPIGHINTVQGDFIF